MMALIWLGGVVAACFGLGRRLLRAGSIRFATAPEELAWSISLGMGFFGMVLFELGLAGLLYRELILALTVLAAILSLPEFARWFARSKAAWLRGDAEDAGGTQFAAESSRTTSRFIGVSLVLAGVAVVAALLGALAPPTAGDALCYHLQLPKVYLAQHRITYLPDSANSTYPLLMEMLFLWGLALEGGVLAQLFHWLVGLLLASATFCLAAPVAGRRVAWLATAIVLLVPGVTNQMTAPLNDLGVALYTTLTLAALLRGMGLVPVPRGGDPRTQGRLMVLAGVCFGFALGVKYVAILCLPGFVVLWVASRLWIAKEHDEEATVGRTLNTGGALRAAVVMSVVSLAVGGGWYLRAAVHTGNPVYPFLSSWFGSPASESVGSDKTPLAHTPAGLLASPWQITMHPERFGGRAAQLGVVFLALVPGLGWVRPGKALTAVLLAAVAYYFMWFLLRQNVRFLLPIVPALAAGAGWVLVRGLFEGDALSLRMPGWMRRGALAAIVLVFGFNTLIAVARARDTVAVAVGLQSRDDFLRQREPSYAVARFAREALSDDAVILSQDYRSFYFKQRVVRENIFRLRTGYDARVEPGPEAVGWLRDAGFTHALLLESTGDDGIRFEATLNRLLAPCLAELPSLLHYEFRDSDGAVRRYRLLALELPRTAVPTGPVRSTLKDTRPPS